MDELKSTDVKALLDGNGSTDSVDSSVGVLETRPGYCQQHGQYQDERIELRAYKGRKAFFMPYWLGCPGCREAWDRGNKREADRWGGSLKLLPADAAEPLLSGRRR